MFNTHTPAEPICGHYLRCGVKLLTWAFVVAIGFHILTRYEVKAGDSKAHPAVWPDDVGLSFDPRHHNLVVLMHPLCPCSRATMAELEKIMTACRDRLATSVLFYAPSNEREDWSRGDLWRRASAIPGVEVHADPDGHAAMRLGAVTSGQVLLFDRTGKLLFSGGITGARGHQGDNAGQGAVVALVRGKKTDVVSTSVFGCSIRNEGSEGSPGQ